MTLLLISVLAALLIPGLALVSVFRVNTNQYLISVSFSYAVFALAMTLARGFEISAKQFYTFYGVGLSLCLAILLLHWIYLWSRKTAADTQESVGRISIQELRYPLIIVLAVAVYHYLVGPYNEVPADIYAHLGYFQQALNWQQQNSLGFTISWPDLMLQKGRPWYQFVAMMHHLAGTSVEQTLFIITWVTKTVFLLAVYQFAVTVFQRHSYRRVIALVSTLFVALHMGINVMAYLRYYSFAPTMLNFVLYWAAIAVFMQSFRRESLVGLWAGLMFVGVLTLAAATVHTQEALFIAVMAALLAVVMLYQHLGARFGKWVFALLPASKSSHPIMLSLIVVVALLGFVAAYVYAAQHLQRAPNIGWRLWDFGNIADWLPRLTVLNMDYQFLRVVTIWGLLVGVLFLVFWRLLKGYPYLVAGVLSVVCTVLNPFFVDLFLRLDNSTTLWRMTYLLPIHFIGGYIFVALWQAIRQSDRLLVKGFSCITLIALIVLLLPIANTAFDRHYSRFPTLAPVASLNSAERIADALDYLRSVEQTRVVLADPVTGYLIAGLTHHRHYRHKFFARRYIDFTFEDYADQPLRSHRGKLLLINRRVPVNSLVGELSGHWPADILSVDRYYPQALLDHIDANPQQFDQQWSSVSGDMAVYKIQ